MTAIIVAQRLFGLSTPAAGVLIAAVMIPYVVVSALKPSHLARLHFPKGAKDLHTAVVGTEVETAQGPPLGPPSWVDLTAIAPLLVVVVLASLGLVRAATVLGARWGWSDITDRGVNDREPDGRAQPDCRASFGEAGPWGCRGQRDLQQQ